MILTTKRKMDLARAASFAIRSMRRTIGLGEQAVVTRDGITWRLDLREGIDLGLYLGQYQKIGGYLAREFLRPGMHVVDIGANVGAFTLPLARLVGEAGHVLAVEATAFAFAKLRANIALNPALAGSITARQAILTSSGEDAAPGSIYSSWRLDTGGDRHPRHQGIAMSTDGAMSITLDDLLAGLPAMGKVDFMKLDVDGNELSVLGGCERTLAACRPSLLVEIAPHVQNEKPGRFEALLAALRGHGYRSCDPSNGHALPLDVPGLSALIPEGASMDILCIADR